MRKVRSLSRLVPLIVIILSLISLVPVTGISAVVATGGVNPLFTAIEANGPKATPVIAPGVSVQLAEDIPLAAPSVNAPVLSPNGFLDIWLYVPRFRQTDPAWSANVMQTCGQTIGNAGCLLTSAAMVFKYYGATSKNPGQLNTCMGNNACPWQFASGANNCSESKATWNNLYGFNYSTLVWALESGWPPILELTSGGNTHWVVVNAVRGDGLSDGNYSISDPLDGTVKGLTSYTNNGWAKNRIAVYTKR
jgi:hypothetical protein